jgi:hypothetical protein
MKNQSTKPELDWEDIFNKYLNQIPEENPDYSNCEIYKPLYVIIGEELEKLEEIKK